MVYKEAILSLINSKGIEFLKNSFLCYSILSDLVGNSYVDLKLVERFFSLSKQIDLVDLFKSKGVEEAIHVLCKTDSNPLLYYDHSFLIEQNNIISGTTNGIVIKSNKIAITSVKKERPYSELMNIKVTADCSSLHISTHNKESVQIKKGTDDIVTVSPSKIKNGCLSLHLSNPSSCYVLFLPNRLYSSLNIKTARATIYVYGKSIYDEFKCKEIEINTINNYCRIVSNSNNFVFNGNGVLHLNCTLNSCDICGNYLHTTISLNNSNTNYKKNYIVDVDKGEINFSMNNHERRPRANHLFSSGQNANANYIVNTDFINIDLKIKNGKICVK